MRQTCRANSDRGCGRGGARSEGPRLSAASEAPAPPRPPGPFSALREDASESPALLVLFLPDTLRDSPGSSRETPPAGFAAAKASPQYHSVLSTVKLVRRRSVPQFPRFEPEEAGLLWGACGVRNAETPRTKSRLFPCPAPEAVGSLDCPPAL